MMQPDSYPNYIKTSSNGRLPAKFLDVFRSEAYIQYIDGGSIRGVAALEKITNRKDV